MVLLQQVLIIPLVYKHLFRRFSASFVLLSADGLESVTGQRAVYAHQTVKRRYGRVDCRHSELTKQFMRQVVGVHTHIDPLNVVLDGRQQVWVLLELIRERLSEALLVYPRLLHGMGHNRSVLVL